MGFRKYAYRGELGERLRKVNGGGEIDFDAHRNEGPSISRTERDLSRNNTEEVDCRRRRLNSGRSTGRLEDRSAELGVGDLGEITQECRMAA